jgi:hypothetical protein
MTFRLSKRSSSERLGKMDFVPQFEELEGLLCICANAGGPTSVMDDLSFDSGWTTQIVGIK